MDIEEFNSKHADSGLRAGIVKKRPEWGYAFACGNIYVPCTLACNVNDGDHVVVAVKTCPDGRFAAKSIWGFDEYCSMKLREEFTPGSVEYVGSCTIVGRVIEAHVTGLKRKLTAKNWAGSQNVTVGLEYHVTVTSPASDDVDASRREVSVSGVSTPTLDAEAGEWSLIVSRTVKLHDLIEDDGKVTDWELHEERLRGVAEAVLAEMMAR